MTRVRRTTAVIAAAIAENVEAYHARRIDHDAFSVNQRALWGYASSRSERFVERVSAQLMGRAYAGETR